MRLDCYRLHRDVPELVPGGVRRDWMDEMDGRHAYRCLPLNMANVSGWEMLCTTGFTATWNGGTEVEDIQIEADEPDALISHLVTSHFRFGIMTFHTGYLFRTPGGWAVWAMGPPNRSKDGLSPLSGLVETDWLPYPFTMNWRFTRPGSVRFEKGEPFCFISLIRPQVLERIEPNLLMLDDNKALKAEYDTWREARSEFNARMDAGDPDAIRQAWQRYYMKGRKPDGRKAEQKHTSRRRLSTPKEGAKR